LKPTFDCHRARDVYLFTDIISQIPTEEVCESELRTWCLNFTKIQRLSSPDHSFIGAGLGVCGKKNYDVRDISLTLDIISQIPMVRM